MSAGETPPLVQNPQFLAFTALAVIAVACWWFLVVSEAAMMSMSGDGVIAEMMFMMMRPGETAPYLAAAAVMWTVMMIAMMTPAVVPMAAVFRGMYRGPDEVRATLVFAGGYLAAWLVFSVIAAVVQWLLHDSRYLHGMALATTTRTAGVLLLLAGCYQLTPLKEVCLSRCRSPIGFFMQHWREGLCGAFSMGWRHGLFCIGCCWVLMLLMFAGGTMSVMTMAALSVFILAERLLPAGPWSARLPGLVMIALGGAIALIA